MAAYPTPHINASPEDFAKTVLMPGDPLRSKFIAENFLDDARLVNNVRCVAVSLCGWSVGSRILTFQGNPGGISK